MLNALKRPNRNGGGYEKPCGAADIARVRRRQAQPFQGFSLWRPIGRLTVQSSQRADAGWPTGSPTAPPSAALRRARFQARPSSAGRLRSLRIAAPAATHRSSSPVCRKRQTSPAALRCSAAHTGYRPATLHLPAPPSTAAIPHARSLRCASQNTTAPLQPLWTGPGSGPCAPLRSAGHGRLRRLRRPANPV
jgi:hypothetical protein